MCRTESTCGSSNHFSHFLADVKQPPTPSRPPFVDTWFPYGFSTTFASQFYHPSCMMPKKRMRCIFHNYTYYSAYRSLNILVRKPCPPSPQKRKEYFSPLPGISPIVTSHAPMLTFFLPSSAFMFPLCIQFSSFLCIPFTLAFPLFSVFLFPIFSQMTPPDIHRPCVIL